MDYAGRYARDAGLRADRMVVEDSYNQSLARFQRDHDLPCMHLPSPVHKLCRCIDARRSWILFTRRLPLFHRLQYDYYADPAL